MKRMEQKIAILLVFALLLGYLPDKKVEAATQTGTVNATSLNVRIGPGTDYDRVTIDGTNAFLVNGAIVTIEKEESNGWYYISFTDRKSVV